MAGLLLACPIRDALAEMNKAGEPFGHGFTNSSHPVGASVAPDTLRICHSIDVVGPMRAMGARVRAGR